MTRPRPTQTPPATFLAGLLAAALAAPLAWAEPPPPRTADGEPPGPDVVSTVLEDTAG